MKLKSFISIFLIFISLISCSQNTLSTNYYSNSNYKKSFSVRIDIKKTQQNFMIDDKSLEISNVNKLSNQFQKIYDESISNQNFIETINKEILNHLHMIGFNPNVDYNISQKIKDNNLLFEKDSESVTPQTETILLTTTYFNSNNEFNKHNIAILIEILRLFEEFNKKYNLAVLFVNNSSNFNNSIDSSINELSTINISSIIDLQFENTLNKITLLNLNESDKLSQFFYDSIKVKPFNYINLSEIINKNNFQNISNKKINFSRIISETNSNDIIKSSNFLISVLADILNTPDKPTISVNDSILRINLNLKNHDTIKQILYKIDEDDYKELTKDTLINFNDSIDLKFKALDLFGNESEELKIKLF